MRLYIIIIALFLLMPFEASSNEVPCDPCSKELSFVCDCLNAFLSNDRQEIEKYASPEASFLTTERLRLIAEFIETHNLKDCGRLEVVGGTLKDNELYLGLYAGPANRSFDVVLVKNDSGQYRLRSIFFSSHFGEEIH